MRKSRPFSALNSLNSPISSNSIKKNSFVFDDDLRHPSIPLNNSLIKFAFHIKNINFFISERRTSVVSRMSQVFNEDKTFFENYEINFMDAFEGGRPF